MSDNAPRGAFRYQNAHWLWLAGAVLVVDQITKQLIVRNFSLFDSVTVLPVFNLVRRHNTGAAFSILSGMPPWFFVALSVVVSIGILIWLHRHPRGERLTAASLSLILGGALGNAIDRATRGYVIDFIDLHIGQWHWPAFNVADSAICIGAALLVLDALLFDRTRRREQEQPKASCKQEEQDEQQDRSE